jgi:hypothetical protein
MLNTIKTGTILIKEGTLLPTGLPVESDAFLPGWRAVRNLDGYGLGRKIEEADWNFFYLAGEIKATVVGRAGVEALRRAVKQILAKRTGQKFNSLEIAKVVSKRFLGVPYLKVFAHSRHIQEGMYLAAARDSHLKAPVAPAAEFGFGSGEQEPQGDNVATHYVAAISSS